MKTQQTTTLDQRKKEFLRLYQDEPELTMFTAAVRSGMSPESLTVELKTDKEFYRRTREICEQRCKNEWEEQKNQKNVK